MKTYPDLSLDKHIEGLVKHLQSHFPQLTEDLFLFYNDEDLARTATDLRIDKKKMMNRAEFEVFFEILCAEGREWINISGDGWYGSYFFNFRRVFPKDRFSRDCHSTRRPCLWRKE